DDDIDVSWFDTTTLARTGEHTDHGILGAAALLDGRLYLTTTSGVVVLSETEEVSPRPSGLRAGEAMAADPVRHRLVIAHVGSVHPDVVAQQPGRSTPQVRAPAPFERGNLVVSAGRIWAVGFGDRRATIARLDPRTLRPVVF